MDSWTTYLSDGRVFNSRDLTYPGGKSPWLTLVDLLKDENSKILKSKFGDLSWEELKNEYSGCPHDLRPKIINITSIKLVVNGRTYNSISLSKESRFKNQVKVSHFWISGMCDWELSMTKNTDYISFSFLVNDSMRIFLWIEKETNESWIEIVDKDDPRNRLPNMEMI